MGTVRANLSEAPAKEAFFGMMINRRFLEQTLIVGSAVSVAPLLRTGQLATYCV